MAFRIQLNTVKEQKAMSTFRVEEPRGRIGTEGKRSGQRHWEDASAVQT